MIGQLPLYLFGAGVGSYATGVSRTRNLGHRVTGGALIGISLILAAVPAGADQFRQATDNAEIRCAISSRELTRISLVGDAFASVSKIASGMPGQDFTVTSEPVRGDIYLSVPDGWTAPALSFFATSRKGFVYKFACSVDDIAAEQVFVTNLALAQAPEPEAAGRSPGSAAIELIKAMAVGAIVPGYVMRQSAEGATRVGDIRLRLMAEYRGGGLLGRHFRVDNVSGGQVTLDPAHLAPGSALAISVGAVTLAPGSGTSLYVVLSSGDEK